MIITQPFDPEVFRADLEIIQNDLNTAFSQQASLFAYYAMQHVTMMRQESQAKMILEITEARLDKGIRDAALTPPLAEGEAVVKVKPLTEAQVSAAISRSPTYIQAARDHNEAKAMVSLAQAATEAFRQRRDMLIQIGANTRQEIAGEMTVRSPTPESVAQDLRRRAAAA